MIPYLIDNACRGRVCSDRTPFIFDRGHRYLDVVRGSNDGRRKTHTEGTWTLVYLPKRPVLPPPAAARRDVRPPAAHPSGRTSFQNRQTHGGQVYVFQGFSKVAPEADWATMKVN